MTTYGFLTTGSNIIEVKAKTPKQGMKTAIRKLNRLKPKFKKLGRNDLGKVTKSYVTYGKSGFATVGVYKRVK